MRRPGGLIEKDPASDEPWGFDWKVGGDLKTQIYLAAGTPGAKYTVMNHVVTNSSPPVVDERSFYVQITNQ